MKNITPCLAYICKITKIHSVILTILAILLTSAARTSAQEAYAVYDNGTLTFYYDNNRASRTGTTYELNKRTGTEYFGRTNIFRTRMEWHCIKCHQSSI